MNEHTKELCHWGLSLGEKKQGHKYVARVEGKRPGSYIYFYDLDKYNRWKQGAKTKINDAGNKLKSTIQNKAKEANKRIREINVSKNRLVTNLSKQILQEKTNMQTAVQKYARDTRVTVRNKTKDVQNSMNRGKQILLKDAARAEKSITNTVQHIPKDIASMGKSAVTETRQKVTKNISAVDNYSRKNIDSLINNIKNVKLTGVKQPNSVASRVRAFISNIARSYVSLLGDALYSIIGKKQKEEAPVIRPNIKKDGTYIASVTYADGKTVKIKNKDDWKRYAEVFKYQNNEQNFMHSVPETRLRDDGSLPSAQEDKADVNEKVGQGRFRTVNCIFCSTAYELRRRGYDVEAPDLASDVNAMNISKMFDVKDSQMTRGARTFDIEDGENIPVSSAYGKTKLNRIKKVDGKTVKEYTLEYYDLKNNDEHIKSFTPAKDFDLSLDKGSQEWKREATSAMKQATKSFPNSSRGMVNVYWAAGGGHSIVWEKDENGKISFYDTQVNKPVTYDIIIKDIDIGAPMQFIRTDDLQLNPSILQRVKSN